MGRLLWLCFLCDTVRVRVLMNDRQETLVHGAKLGSAVHCNTMQGPALQEQRHRQVDSLIHCELEHVSITMFLDQRLEWLWGAP